MNTAIRLRSGAAINEIRKKEAEARGYLTRGIMYQMHLMPGDDPVAYSTNEDGSVVYYYDPETVVEAPPELWYFPDAKTETMTLPSGNRIPRMSIKRAAACGYYTRERLLRLHYEVVEEPVAYTYKSDKSPLFFYDKKTAIRQPLICARCGKAPRFRKKLCEVCYNQELAVRRAEGEQHRNAEYNMERSRVLFFDLELTGFYERDEIISISIVNGHGDVILNSLIKPVRTKKWKKTEKIHGITPDMTLNAPALEEIAPVIRNIFDNADLLVAYGVSTDYSHIKHIYPTEEEREALKRKLRCCANEFVRYANECRPDIQHASLSDAMECFGIEWEGTAHTSIADTYACRRVWDRLFPNFYRDSPGLRPQA